MNIHDSLSSQGIDTRYSGSTLSLAIFSDDLIVSNVGDSQIILGSLQASIKNQQVWNTKLLSKIHCPKDREEAQRISKAGGRITWGEPNRIWLRGEDVPGLTVTRSIGDTVAGQIGVIPEPFIDRIHLNSFDKWLAICSDGVTDVLEHEEISKIIKSFYNNNSAQLAAEKIVKAARDKWNQETIDDITCVLVFFEAS